MTPTTPTRTGLTLIEVVAAAALLTLIVVACLPLITGARRDLRMAREVALGEPAEETSEAIEELLRQKPGLVSELLDVPEGLEVRWTVREREYQATIRLAARVEGDERRSSHAWAVFRVGGVGGAEFPRWLRLPDLPPEPSP